MNAARTGIDIAATSNTWQKVKMAAASVWPDAYVSALIAIAGIVGLITREGVERLTIAKIIPLWAADIYVGIIVVSCLTIVVSITRRNAILASRGAVILSLMIALNGFSLYLEFKGDAVLTMTAYFALAILLMNRSFVLRHRVLVPWWLAEAAAIRTPRRERRTPRR